MGTDTRKAFTSVQDRAPVKTDPSGTDGLAGSVTKDRLRSFLSTPQPAFLTPRRNAPRKTNAKNFGGVGGKAPNSSALL
jgi:hypothetical protein